MQKDAKSSGAKGPCGTIQEQCILEASSGECDGVDPASPRNGDSGLAEGFMEP